MGAQGQATGRQFAAAVIAAMTLAGCSSSDGTLNVPFLAPQAGPAGAALPKGATRESDKIVKLPATAEELDCPEVDVSEGGATARVGGPDSQSVRYQFDISDVARQCDPQGAQFALKVGVAGRLLIGPAGRPGAYSTSLHVRVTRDADNKSVYDKNISIAANTGGADNAAFHIVTDPILLPLTRARLNDDYSITVGFGTGGGAVTHHRRARHRG
jgi:hypothetical protein